MPGGRDAADDFAARGLPRPGDGRHAPVNFHALAAATGGRFVTDPAALPPPPADVLLLIPRRARRALAAARTLAAIGYTIFVSRKECGRHQLDQARRHRGVDAATSGFARAAVAVSTPAREHFADLLPGLSVIDLPTPYPVGEEAWSSFPAPLAGRRGILIGTREWRVPARRHHQAMELALELAARHPGARPVTCILPRGLANRLRARRYPGVRFLPPLAYASWLGEIAAHRLVLQRDQSEVPGQVAGDCLLAGTPCLGGNGRIDRIGFAHLPGADNAAEEVRSAAARLLASDEAWKASVEESAACATRELSFEAFRRSWKECLA